MAAVLGVKGFRISPKSSVRGRTYRGRFTCPDIQWTGAGSELIGTFTINAEELADAAENRLIWIDKGVQKGILPAIDPVPPRELCLADGYPDSRL
jgi:hypothetical protein